MPTTPAGMTMEQQLLKRAAHVVGCQDGKCWPTCDYAFFKGAADELARRSPTPADGWKFVPTELTEDMVDAYAHAGKEIFFSSNEARERWKAMLEAVPIPPDRALTPAGEGVTDEMVSVAMRAFWGDVNVPVAPGELRRMRAALEAVRPTPPASGAMREARYRKADAEKVAAELNAALPLPSTAEGTPPTS